MRIPRLFTRELKGPYDGLEFESRRSEIREPDGRVVFSQEGVMVPSSWSQVATDILAQKYFRRTGVPNKGGESDSREVFNRLAGCWTTWGEKAGYFTGKEDAEHFYDEVRFMLSRQMAAPNSPQWFNTGLHYAYGISGPAQGHFFVDPKTGELKESDNAYEHPQPHACFIQKVEDDLVGDEGIMSLWTREARLFKYGSGSGTNFSALRAAGEKLSGGGRSSGLMSFLKIGDRAAGAIKSGGTTRRAAKMVCLDLDHPEIEEFIQWKEREEQKVAALVTGSRVQRRKLLAIAEASRSGETTRLKKAVASAQEVGVPGGAIQRVLQLSAQGVSEAEMKSEMPEFDTGWENEAYLTVSGQNSNNSVRVPNSFFKALETGKGWSLRWRSNGEVAKEVPARRLWNLIGSAAWSSADPGLQYDTTINEWHTCPEGGRINASNPCSEYMFLDDTACNLASLNLMKFYDSKTRVFDLESYTHAIRLWTIVLEISVLMAQFPSPAIAQNSHDYRTLGLGYANLGALLMTMGMPYGSEAAKGVCGALTAILTGECYATSSEMAKERGSFKHFEKNKEAMLRVIRNHRRAAYGEKAENYEGLEVTPEGLDPAHCPAELLAAARMAWDRALELGEQYGYRNAQVSVVAPTGTIGLLMDCDTTGIEPDFSLVKFKKLSGGGYLKIINQSVPLALAALGYLPEQVKAIVNYCAGTYDLSQAPHLSFTALRERGFGDRELELVHSHLRQAFDIRFVFNPTVLGKSFLVEKLGIEESKLSDPSFDLLTELGFEEAKIQEAQGALLGKMTVEGAPFLKEEHYGVFNCASKCGKEGSQVLPPEAHIDMMAAAQPFVSGAISKTINMPAESTVEDVKNAYLVAWQKMIKAISIYRDGSKLSQPLSASWTKDVAHEEEEADATPRAPSIKGRRELPNRRFGYTVKATIGGQRVYLRTGEYEDGSLGEIFVDMYKEGAAYRALMNAFSISVSLGLQYGVPLEEFVNKFHLFKFEPNGFVGDHDHIKFCSSIIDFLFRDLALNYLGRTDLVHVPPTQVSAYETASPSQGMALAAPSSERVDASLTLREYEDTQALASKVARTQGYEGDPCGECGHFTLVRSGTCRRCVSCGTSSGCSG